MAYCFIWLSCIFRAFLDKTVEKSEKIRLLRRACEVHAKMYKDAMNGLGIDRHLFALYVVSKGLDYVSTLKRIWRSVEHWFQPHYGYIQWFSFSSIVTAYKQNLIVGASISSVYTSNVVYKVFELMYVQIFYTSFCSIVTSE